MAAKRLSFAAVAGIALTGAVILGDAVGMASATPGLLGVDYSGNSLVTEARCTRPDEANLTGHGCYVNRFGREVHRPSRTYNGGPPTQATARCRDGTYSFSQHATGTCSHHGGVASWR